jgi:hypothetical protein
MLLAKVDLPVCDVPQISRKGGFSGIGTFIKRVGVRHNAELTVFAMPSV